MKVLGVDPGIKGGLAIVELVDDTAPRLLSAIDVPTVGTGAGERVDAAAIRDWIGQHRPDFAYVERAQAMPHQGSSSEFKYGRSVGALETVIVLCGVPMQIVEPTKWKRHWRLPAKEKEKSRQRALELFPGAHALLARKRDHGRAEAALLALYGAHTFRIAAPGITALINSALTIPTVSESGGAT